MQARARSVRRIFEARILNDLFNWELGRTLGKRPHGRASLVATSIAQGPREQVNLYFCSARTTRGCKSLVCSSKSPTAIRLPCSSSILIRLASGHASSSLRTPMPCLARLTSSALRCTKGSLESAAPGGRRIVPSDPSTMLSLSCASVAAADSAKSPARVRRSSAKCAAVPSRRPKSSASVRM